MTRSLLEDQQQVLARAVQAWKAQAPDIVIIAGDIFDRAIPPEDAVRLLDLTLEQLLGFVEHVILIPGNHDSAGRLGFASTFLRSRGLHVLASPANALKPLNLSTELDSIVQIWAVPFLEPSEWRALLGDDLRTHEDVHARLNEVWQNHPPISSTARRLLVCHAFIHGGLCSDSERPLQIGGSETLSPQSFEKFDYVALGHLHRPQSMANDRLVYPGSLFPYSSSEASQDKGYRLIEVESGKSLRHSFHPFAQQRRLHVHRGQFEALLKGTQPAETLSQGKNSLLGSIANPGDCGIERPDYVVIHLEDSQLPFEAFRRLQQVYPALLHVSRAWRDTETRSPSEELRLF